MSAHIIQTIADLEKKVKEYEDHSLRLKTTINELCQMAGLPARYSAAALKPQNGSAGMTIRSDQFHARPVATIIREYLEMRKSADLGPATTEEIFEALEQGGYEFKTKNDQIARISLNNALTKNSVFYKLPNKRWGLLDWYPKAKQQRELEPSEDEKEVGTFEAQENKAKREHDEAAQKEAEENI